VAAARALHNGKGRARASAFLVEGPHAVTAALDAPGYRVRELFVTDDLADRETALMRAAAGQDVPIRLVTPAVLRRISDTVTPQGAVAVVAVPAGAACRGFETQPRLAVLLDQISDPGNAGTVIRTADAAGAGLVVLTRGGVDVWSGKCVRASAGSLFNVEVATDVAALDAVAQARRAGLVVLATSAQGDDDLDELVDSGELARPTLWALGNEAHGLDPAVCDAADRVVRIPIYGSAESLNLAVASAICLYASARAQRH
jgi:RNA methyltransferase, TrmH family